MSIESEIKQYRLVRKLLERTELGQLDWTEGPATDTYLASFTDFSVSIRTYDDDYFVSIRNDLGEVIDNFSDGSLYMSLKDEIGVGEMASVPYQLMAKLFDVVRRQASGADDALDSILGELD
jgi:hypothetical protein